MQSQTAYFFQRVAQWRKHDVIVNYDQKIHAFFKVCFIKFPCGTISNFFGHPRVVVGWELS